MDDQIKQAEQEREARQLKEQGAKARRLFEELTPYIQEIELDFQEALLEVEFDKPESVAEHQERVRTMQNLNRLQDKLDEYVKKGYHAGKALEKLEKNSR